MVHSQKLLGNDISNPIFFSIGIPNSFSPQDPGPGPLDPGTGLAAAACPRAGSPRRRSSPRRRRRPGATGPDEGPETSGTIDLRSEIYHKSIINPRYLGVTTRFFWNGRGYWQYLGWEFIVHVSWFQWISWYETKQMRNWTLEIIYI
jgi:hypothetical protein